MSDVQVVSIEECRELLERLGMADPVRGAKPQGVMLKGYVDAWFRDATTGKLEDEVHQPNLITDFARRAFIYHAQTLAYQSSNSNGSGALLIFTSPSRETPHPKRYVLLDSNAANGSQVPLGTANTYLPVSYDGNTLTRSWSTTFGTPPSTRIIGTIGLCRDRRACGITGIHAYTLLAPARSQTVNQTLEVLYRVTLNPVF